METSALNSLLNQFKKLQVELSFSPSSSGPSDVPQLNQVDEMVYEVYTPLPREKPDLEIVFFHGLQLGYSSEAHITTWMSNDNSHLWLQTWLVEAFPRARILTISYDSCIKKTHQAGNLDMYCAAENLVTELTVGDGVRIGQARCPIVFVGHCLGGLVLKEVCLSAHYRLSREKLESREVGRLRDLLSNLKGMFFYGTPHMGALMGDDLRSFPPGALVQEIEILNTLSGRRNFEFQKLRSIYSWQTYGISELYKTYVEYCGKSIHIVPEASARCDMDRFYSASADHFEICKPKGKNDSRFSKLRQFLAEVRITAFVTRNKAFFENAYELVTMLGLVQARRFSENFNIVQSPNLYGA